MVRRTLLVALALACGNPASIPAWRVGPASYAVVLSADALETTFYRQGDTVQVAHAGDSVCVHFVADNSWQTVVFSNATYLYMTADWLPHDTFPHMTFRFTGPQSRQKGAVGRALC